MFLTVPFSGSHYTGVLGIYECAFHGIFWNNINDCVSNSHEGVEGASIKEVMGLKTGGY